MAIDEHVRELLPAYALDCLDEEEMVFVSEHLAVCDVCQVELQVFETTSAQLAMAAPDAAPPPELQRRLMSRIELSGAKVSTSFSAPWWQPLANLVRSAVPVWGVVSLLLIVLLATSNLWLWQRVNHLEAATRPSGLRAIAVPLSGTNVAPNASGFVIVGADGQNGALVVDNLPLLDPEQQYQLWLIQDGHRTSGAVFSVDEFGYGGTRISAPESLFEYATFGVSIEPAGGSPSPTGEKVLGGIFQ